MTCQELKEIRKNAGLTMEELGALIGISKQNYSQYEYGNRTITPKFIKKIQEALPDANVTQSKSNALQIPLYESVSAGLGTYADDNIVEYISPVALSQSDIAETVAIRVKGDSMSPTINDGDIIQVRRNRQAFPGKVVVALIDDEAYVKEFRYENDTIVLHSFNPLYEDIKISLSDSDKLTIYGVVHAVIHVF